MDKIEVTNRNILKKHRIPVGFGQSACVFMGKENNVVKYFYDGYLESLKHQGDYLGKLSKICNLSNEKIIGPKKLIFENNKFIGYSYEYIKGKQLDEISTFTKINDLFIDYSNACNEIKRLTDNYFDFFDLYARNIVFYNNKYYFIDLDKGNFDEDSSKEKLYLESRKKFFEEIVYSIYGLRHSDYPKYKNVDINSYLNGYNHDEAAIKKFLEEIKNACNEEKPTIRKVRKNTLASKKATFYHQCF